MLVPKTLTARIRSLGEGLKRFSETYKAVEAGRPAAPACVFRTRRARSVYELAEIVSRGLKNVQDDLRALERYELVAVGWRGARWKR